MSESTPTETNAPIATYHEERFDSKRVYELRTDVIRIQGKTFLQSEFETTLPLIQIDPRIVRIRARNPSCWTGLTIAVIAGVTYSILVSGFGLEPYASAPGLVGVLGLSGLGLSFANLRKVEFARFESTAGVAILDIARAGPDSDQFDEFVARVLNQAKDVRGHNPSNR